MIKRDVKETFEKIAEKFSILRKLPWPDLVDFISESNFIESEDLGFILDLGCGNARHIRYIKDEAKNDRSLKGVGVDIALKFLKIAKQIDASIYYVNADANYLPFKNNLFRQILYIAAIHHISKKEMRLKSLLELERILTPNGIILISVWRLWQDRFYRYFLNELKERKFENWDGEFGDIWVPWRDQERNVIAERFYHLFSIDEFKDLIRESGFEIEDFKIAGTRKEKGTIFATLKIK
ncbi:MAG: methyltransferase domain-containing protein [Candidatus Lokiarchaeota archaeon]|nr:methyltransferase domain-containing protein [Candidatus Lokiarchaeota archaeon]